MGHTDVVPVNARRLAPRSLRRRARSTARCGAAAPIDMLNLTASMAVATRRLADAGFRPDGTLSTSRSPTRRRWARSAPTISPSTRPTRCAPTTSSPSRAASRSQTGGGVKLPVIVAEKGPYWCTPRGAGHARPRLDAVRHRQRAGQGGRGRAPPGRVPARDRDRTTSGGASSRRSGCPTRWLRRCSTAERLRRRRASALPPRPGSAWRTPAPTRRSPPR